VPHLPARLAHHQPEDFLSTLEQLPPRHLDRRPLHHLGHRLHHLGHRLHHLGHRLPLPPLPLLLPHLSLLPLLPHLPLLPLLPHLQRPYQQPAAWEEDRHHLPGEGAVQHRHHLPGEEGAVQNRHHLPEAVVAGQKPTLERAPTTILQL